MKQSDVILEENSLFCMSDAVRYSI